LPNNTNQKAEGQSQLLFQNGFELLQQGKLEEADTLFLQAHLLDLKNIDVLNILGIRAYQKQDYSNALKFLNSANALAPHSVQTLSNLGLTHHANGHFYNALEYFDQAIAINPNIPETHNNRGNTLKGLNKNKEAIKAYQHALDLRPNYGEALSNYGVMILEEGYPEKAIPLFEQAINANPNLAVAFNNLGNALTQLESYDSAFQCFERALQIHPGYVDACLNFGNSLKKCKQYSAAIDCYEHALKIQPENAKTFYLLGEIYFETGDSELAKTYYAKSLERDPSDLRALYALTIAQIPKVYKSGAELLESRQSFAEQLERLKIDEINSLQAEETTNILARHPFYLAYQDESNEPLLTQFGMLCADLARPLQDHLITQKALNPRSSKVRIGIVSSFLCNHPVWHAITKGWVSHLNPKQFELHLFNTNGAEDDETALAKSKVASYSNCGIDVMRAAQMIADQNLDIILYPEIGMDTISKSLACLRLSPTQVASWGHPETTGIPSIDFFLSAQLLEPNNASQFYSEKLTSLPNLGTYFENAVIQSTPPNLEALDINPSLPILLCAGSPSKYSPIHDWVFVEIAKKLGQCQFVFFNFDENLTSILKERLRITFANAQLNANQFVRFIPFLRKEEFHGLMQEADLYLDTIGFSGFNTAMQAIACNLPVITVEGSKMRGRLGSGILDRIGLRELICPSDTAYIDLVVQLIQNQELLSYYRDKIAKSKSILFADLEPIKALEDFLIQQTLQLHPSS
jgi:protein O-GlcNAc transferase